MTFLCVSIFVDEVHLALADAERAGSLGADLVEWRVDRLADDIASVERLARESPLPCIVTCRLADEGGECEVDEQQRIALFEHVGLHARPRYIDVELSAFDSSANLRQKVMLAIAHPDQRRDLDTGLILSSHDFKSRPADLLRRLARMSVHDAVAVIKLAWTARSVRDNLEAFEILRSSPKPTIALCMGPHGLMSRVLAPKFGGLLTFASMDAKSATAPGQPTVSELVDRYRFKSIDRETKVYGVIGHPIGHSRSPEFHNAGFAHIGFNGVYLPLDVAPDQLAFDVTLEALLDDAHLDFLGASVTLPHKAHLLEFVVKRGGVVSPDARLAGAANTLIVHADKRLEARNSDGMAIMETIGRAFSIDHEDGWRKVNVAIIGAGGMARAAASQFALHGAAVRVFNRTPEHGATICEAMGAQFAQMGVDVRLGSESLDALSDAECDVVINATPVGMEGGPDPKGIVIPGVSESAPPLRPVGWLGSAFVVDTVYTPATTPLLRWARTHGCRTLDGRDLFLRQAMKQFEWWTGTALSAQWARQVL